MKRLLFLFAVLAAFSACKKNEQKDVNAKDVPAEKVLTTDTLVGDYTKYGVKEDAVFIVPAVGSKAHDFTLQDAEGNTHTLSNLYKKGPIALVFYRGNWCPYCNKYLSALTAGEVLLKEKDITVVAITPEVNDNIAKTKEKSKSNILILSDADGSVMNNYGVGFELNQNMQNRFTEVFDFDFTKEHTTGEAILPVPATFVINTNGEIVFKHFNPQYNERASVEDIINSL